jgi:hypothetical protein
MVLPREPQRRTEPRKHLDVSVVPVERALLARARVLEEESTRVGPASLLTLRTVAAEFRALAEELHYW